MVRLWHRIVAQVARMLLLLLLVVSQFVLRLLMQ